jgi:hypothetical protein
MLLHLNFCIEWFDSNSKEDSKSFEKCCEKKKKRNFFSSLLLAQLSPAAHRSPTSVFPARGPFFFPSTSRFGPSPASAAGPARVRAPPASLYRH